MLSSEIVFLFDVDGVLVDPLAYKAGVTRGLEILCKDIGLTNIEILLPSPSEFAFMESRGIHDVWDMINIMFSLVLMGVLQNLQSRNILLDLSDKSTAESLALLKTSAPQIVHPDYNKFAESLVAVQGSTHPPQQALELIYKALLNPGSTLRAALNARDARQWDPAVLAGFQPASPRSTPVAAPGWKKLFESFLANTRNANESYGTKLFQNIILGNQDFESTYGTESQFKGPSLLRTEDKVNISPTSVERLQKLRQANKIRIAIYTARPSLAPANLGTLKGYSPEAEIAVEAAGLDNLPLVGMGMMDWLAESFDERSEDLTKPNTTHALAALMAALNGNVSTQLLEQSYKANKAPGKFDKALFSEIEGSSLHIFLFEDTSSGITPMISLADKLNSSGIRTTLSALGIAHDENKKTALHSLCQQVFPEVNSAIDHALLQIEPRIKM